MGRILDPVPNSGSISASSAQINLCGSTYAATPGTDVTATIQAALNWAAANCPNGADLYFSKPGTYYVNGTPQTGAAQGYSYNGQILIPAVALAASMPIRIRGPFPSSGGGQSTGSPNGVVLLSNATSGYVFDIIPAFTEFGCPWTGVMPIFENLVIRSAVDNPTMGGLNLLCTQRAKIERVQIDTPNSFVAPTSGSLEALVMPQIYNNGDVTVRDVTIRGYPVGVRLGEHGVFDNVDVAYCLTAFKGGGSSHANWLGYVDVEECPTTFDGGVAPAFGSPAPAAGSVVYGALDHENVNTGSLKPVAFVNDTSTNQIVGKLDVYGTIAGSFPVTGGRGLDTTPVYVTSTLGPKQRGSGWMESHPYDNFTRQIALSGTGAPGQCSPSLHPWRADTGSFAVSAGRLTGLTASNYCFVPALKAQNTGPGVSRMLTLGFNLAASGNVQLVAAARNPGTGSSNGGATAIIVRVQQGLALQLRMNNNQVAVASGTVAAGTHTVQLAVFHDATGYPYAVKVYLDGSLAITSAVPTSLAALGGRTPGGTIYYEDGIGILDTTSYVTLFSAQDIAVDPAPSTVTAITYAASMTPDASQGVYQTITVTDTNAMTINAPSNPLVATQSRDLTIEVKNSSGGAMGTITWDAAFVFAGATWTNPASTKKRAAHFRWNGVNWICVAVSAADY